MASDPASDPTSYLRIPIVTAAHPENGLSGTVLAVSTSLDADPNGEILSQVISAAGERFNVESFVHELRVGTIYVTESEYNVVGVTWHESPVPYEHGELTEPVNDLPDDLTLIEEILAE